MAPRRRLAQRVAALAVLIAAVAAVLAVVIGSHSGEPTVRPPVATASTPQPPPVHRRRRVRHLPPAPAQVTGDAARRMPIPILMYHVVGNRPPAAPYPELWVAPTTFAAQMNALRRAGYYAITLRQAYDAWTSGGPLPRRPVVLSFDDGYLGDWTNVRPVLRRLRWPGVLNLVLHNLASGDLSPSKERGLIRNGWEVDSHTITHIDLTTVGAAQLRTELVDSKRQLHSRFGVPADFFCYPVGRYDDQVVAAVKAAGYLAATTENEGYGRPESMFTLARIRVNDTDTPATLLARLQSER